MHPATPLLLIFCLGLLPAAVHGAPDVQPGPEVEFDQAVHFSSAQGDDVLVTPGTYQVTAKDNTLRLMTQSASEDHADPLLIQAGASTHSLQLETPELLSIVGEDGNAHHLVYLMPGGHAFEAVGSYHAVRTRAATRLWSTKINQPRLFRQYTRRPALQARVGSSVRNLSQLKAQMTRLQIKMKELQEALFDENIDAAKAQYEVAKEQFKKALRILQEHQERQTQVIQKITQ